VSAAPNRSGWAAWTVDRPVATTMIVLAVVVFGQVSLQQLPVNLMPEISHPTLTVRTTWDGSAPEEVEDAVTEPLEELLGTVEGAVGVTSISRAGSSDVLLTFAWGTSLDTASQKVRERIGWIEMPDGADPPLVLRYDPTLDPILRLAVYGDVPTAQLRRLAEDEVQRVIEKVPGVAMVRVLGGDEEVVRVSVDEGALQARGLEIRVIGDRLRAENVNVAGGRLYEGEVEYLVRTVNEFETLEDLAGLVVAREGDRVVRLGDVATVERAARERQNLTRVHGVESVEIAVYREADANLVAVSEAVMWRLFGDLEDDRDGFERHLPEGVSMEVLSDQSRFIRAAIAEVTNTALTGGLFAVLVLFLFLRNAWATVVIGLAIPLSVIATFAPMRLLGVSMNLMSLGGLALGIGMLVDNAIVVLESIVRCREEGDDPRGAAIRGTREVGGAVVASTLTTVAVFLPIGFVRGVAGQLFGDLALAVVLSLVASLVFALFFVPMLAVLPDRLRTAARDAEAASLPSFWPPPSVRQVAADARSAAAGWRAAGWIGRILRLLVAPLAIVWIVVRTVSMLVVEVFGAVAAIGWFVARGALFVARLLARGAAAVGRPIGRAFDVAFDGVTAVYRFSLTTALRVGLLVIGGAIALSALAVERYPELGMQLIPELHQGELTAVLRWPVGTRIEETADRVAGIERALGSTDAIERISTFVGERPDDLDASDQGEHYAEITIVVPDAEDVVAAEEAAIVAIREALARQPAMTWELTRPTLFSISAPVSVQILGHDLDALSRSASLVVDTVATTPGVTDVRTSARAGYPEVRITFDRERLATWGIDVRAAAEAVRDKVRGSDVTEMSDEGRAIDVELRARASDVETLAGLRALEIGRVRVEGEGAGTARVEAESMVPGQRIDVGVLSVEQATEPVVLGAVADVSIAEGPAEIRHIDGQRAAVIEADTTLVDLAATADRLAARLDGLRLEPGQDLRVAGQSEEMTLARDSLLFALSLAVFLVYVVMASKFESFVAPFVILLTVPLAWIGVVGSLDITGTPVSVVVFIGAIVLTGIVVNNAIVLVDYIIQLRGRGRGRTAAIVEACSVRLRPVLITATTTVLGLLPMALGLGEGAEIRRPLALVVISGLVASTVLTLVVVPVVYAWIGELGRRFDTPPSDDPLGPDADAGAEPAPDPAAEGAA